jgi:(2Fe-2S) ferredoxin
MAEPDTSPEPVLLEGFAQHLLVCQGRACLAAGADTLLEAAQAMLDQRGRWKGPARVKVTQTHCLGPCRYAPVVTLYPLGRWYGAVRVGRLPDLLQLLLDRAHPDEKGTQQNA